MLTIPPPMVPYKESSPPPYKNTILLCSTGMDLYFSEMCSVAFLLVDVISINFIQNLLTIPPPPVAIGEGGGGS